MTGPSRDRGGKSTQAWAEVATATHLFQIAAESAAQASLERNPEGLFVQLSNAEAAIRKAKRNLRRALKAEGAL